MIPAGIPILGPFTHFFFFFFFFLVTFRHAHSLEILLVTKQQQSTSFPSLVQRSIPSMGLTEMEGGGSLAMRAFLHLTNRIAPSRLLAAFCTF